MDVTILGASADGALADEAGAAWRWADVTGTGDHAAVLEWGGQLGIDPITLADAVAESDQPKYDDLGTHLAFTIHTPAIRADGGIDSTEVDCILLEDLFVSVHRVPSASIEWAQSRFRDRGDWRRGPGLLFVSVLDVIARRWVPVVENLDRVADQLALAALEGEEVVADVTTLRMYEADIRQVLVPLLAALDEAVAGGHPLLGDEAVRRMRDVRDVVARSLGFLETTRSVLGDALAVYHGLAAHRMAKATTVFTIYAALMLPLTFITGFFGMNFSTLPGTRSTDGWVIAIGIMAVSLLVSVVVFWRAGLITPERGVRPTTTELVRTALSAPIRAVGSLAPRRR